MTRLTFTQRVRPCGDHPACTVIVCTEDAAGRQIWESHAHEATHPGCRANPDHPLLAADGSPLDPTQPQCADCMAYFSG